MWRRLHEEVIRHSLMVKARPNVAQVQSLARLVNGFEVEGDGTDLRWRNNANLERPALLFKMRLSGFPCVNCAGGIFYLLSVSRIKQEKSDCFTIWIFIFLYLSSSINRDYIFSSFQLSRLNQAIKHIKEPFRWTGWYVVNSGCTYTHLFAFLAYVAVAISAQVFPVSCQMYPSIIGKLITSNWELYGLCRVFFFYCKVALKPVRLKGSTSIKHLSLNYSPHPTPFINVHFK